MPKYFIEQSRTSLSLCKDDSLTALFSKPWESAPTISLLVGRLRMHTALPQLRAGFVGAKETCILRVELQSVYHIKLQTPSDIDYPVFKVFNKPICV